MSTARYATLVVLCRARASYDWLAFDPEQRRDERGRWTKSPMGDAALEAVKDLVDIVDVIERDDIEPSYRYGGATGETLRFDLPDGRSIIRKRVQAWGDDDAPRRDADAEQLAGVMAGALGVRTARVYRADERTVWIEPIAGETIGFDGLPGPNVADLPDNPNAIVRLGLLDVLSANNDRHAGNMIDSGNGIVGIDQGAAWSLANFEDETSLSALGPIDSARPLWHFARNDDSGSGNWSSNRHWLDNPMTPSDIDETRARLGTLRPEFERTGREAWLDYSLGVLDEIAPHARGTVSIYG